MGTYTTNYNLFMPTVGEQGWGTLVNGNFTTIDTTMGGLNTRIGTLETEMDAVEARVTTLEEGEFETVNVAGTVIADVGNFSSLDNISTTDVTNILIYTPTTFNTGQISSSSTQTLTIPAYKSKIKLPYDVMEYTITQVCGVTNRDTTVSTTHVLITDVDTGEVFYDKGLTKSVPPSDSSISDTATIYINPYHTTTFKLTYTVNFSGYATSSFTATTTAQKCYL